MKRSKLFWLLTPLLSTLIILSAGCRSAESPTETQKEEALALPSPNGTRFLTRYRAALHSSPSTLEGDVLAEIPAGTLLDAVSSNADWTQVLYQQQTGYVYNHFLSLPGEEIPSVAAENPAPEAPAPASVSGVHALSEEELNAIAAMYDATPKGYGAPLDAINEDGINSEALRTEGLLSGFNTRFFGDRSTKTVYLTFSLGWENAPNTSRILDTLKEAGIHAVFYVTHEYASRNPDLIWRMIEEGHEIANHSYSHPSNGMPSLSLAEQMQDTLNMQQYIKDAYGFTMQKYNFNNSSWSEQSVALLSQMGYEVCFFSFNYADYDVSKPADPADVYDMLMTALSPGCVYYLHPVSTGNTDALPEFIRDARAEGYRFGLLP